MKKITYITATLILLLAMTACNRKKEKATEYNTLTKEEVSQGWQLLFDGKSLDGWKGYNHDDCGERWTVKDGDLVCLGEGGGMGYDIVTKQKFANFELSLEWKISPQGNSGIFYHVIEDTAFDNPYETSPEYQLIDDLGWPEKLEEWQKTGADYAMNLPDTNAKKLNPIGEWNTSKIVFNKGHVEHWLNGVKILKFTAWDDEWTQHKSEGKWKDYPGYGLSKEGAIGLQNHGSPIWFRNIKIRPL
jgi:hypothetical protein